MPNPSEHGTLFFKPLSRLIATSREVKTVYAVAAVALSFLFFFVFLTLKSIQPVSLSSKQFLLLVSLFLITLLIILWIGRKEYPDAGKLIPESEKAIFPDNIYNDEQTISSLNNMVLILAVANVSDYGATVNRLRNNLINLTYESITSIGIYGEYDLLFELICKSDNYNLNMSIIKNELEIDETTPKIFQEIQVQRVAKLSGYPIGGISHNGILKSIPLVNRQFNSEAQRLSYKIISIKKLKNSGDLDVPNMPVIISYIWVEPSLNILNNQNSLRTADRASLNIYNQLCQENPEEIRSLFLVSNPSSQLNLEISSVIIKSVFLVKRYYALMKFTKKIDRMLRGLGYSNLLQIRTVVGAEVILWK